MTINPAYLNRLHKNIIGNAHSAEPPSTPAEDTSIIEGEIVSIRTVDCSLPLLPAPSPATMRCTPEKTPLPLTQEFETTLEEAISDTALEENPLVLEEENVEVAAEPGPKDLAFQDFSSDEIESPLEMAFESFAL